MRYGFLDKNGGAGVPLEKIQVRGNIKGFTAEVTATMEYKNSGDGPIEAMYVFPLDEEAAVCGFQATIDGRTIVAEIQEKQEARDTYDDAISSGHSAFLLEESDESSDIFQINVGNLPQKQSAILELTFVTTLSVEKEGRIVFVLPTVLNPRYSPSNSNQSVSATMPSIASVSTKYSFAFELDVECASPIQEITSPCNRLKVDISSEDNRHAIVRLGDDYKFDADVQVHILCSKPFEPSAMLEIGALSDSKKDKEAEFIAKPIVMLNFFPLLDNCTSTERSEFVFLVDRSGSMDGSNIESAKETLLLFLKSLPEACLFNVIGFGSSFEKLFPKSQSYNDSSLDRACSHAKSMDADLVGTEILNPLKDVFSEPLVQGYPRQIFVLTDGEVGNTQQVIELVRKNASKARCFTVGIGAGASTALVKGVARAGNGTSEFVSSGDKLQVKVMKLLKNALQPALSDCSVTWDLPKGFSAKSIPQVPPPIFSGNKLVVYGLITHDSLNKVDSGIKGSITLSANLTSGSKGEKIQHKLSLEDLHSKEDSLLLHRLASKAWIQAAKQDCSDNNDATNQEVVQISKSTNVVSKLTSFVAVDKETQNPISTALSRNTLPDIEYSCLFGAAMPLSQACAPQRLCTHTAFYAYECESDDEDHAVFSNSETMYFTQLAPPIPARRRCCQSRRSAPPIPDRRRCCQSRRSAPPIPARRRSPEPVTLRANFVSAEHLFDDMFDCYNDVESDLDSTSKTSYLGIVALQKASGAWQLTDKLASLCGVTLDELKQACPSQLTKDSKDNLWATAIALSCLAGRFADQKDEWEMVATKATNWLKTNMSTQALSYDEIVKSASQFLSQN